MSFNKNLNILYNSEINIINQGVDTLKLHLYPKEPTEKEIIKYNNTIDDIKTYKKKAMELVSRNQDERYVLYNLGGNDFKVMATTMRGFSVTIINSDISISFKRIGGYSTPNPICKIEFRAEYLARYGYVECVNQVKKLFTFLISDYQFKVSEMHLCADIQGYDFNHLDLYKFQTTARSKNSFSNQTFFNKHELTGFYLGSSNSLLRIYNKTLEINKFKNKGFIEAVRWERNKLYDKNKTVWRIEFQIRREELKKLISDDGLLDDYEKTLNAIPDIWSMALKKFKHKNLSDKQCLEMLRGTTTNKKGDPIILTPHAIKMRFQRAEYTPLWQIIQSFNETQGKELTRYEELKKPSKQYVYNALKSVISTSMKLNKGKYSPNLISDLLLEAEQDNLNKKNLNLVDDSRIKQLKYLKNIEYMEGKFGLVPISHSDRKTYIRNIHHDIDTSYRILEDMPVNIETFVQYNKALENVS